MSLFKRLFGGANKSDNHREKEHSDIDKLLSSDNVDGIIIELDNRIGELCSYGDEMELLNEEQKLFYYNQCLEREINNGGFNQYFYNSSGDFAHQTIQSLMKIGAVATAGILQQAIDQFPDQRVPQDRTERQEILEQIEELANPVWEKLDQQFYVYEDKLDLLNFEFLKSNKSKFEGLL